MCRHCCCWRSWVCCYVLVVAAAGAGASTDSLYKPGSSWTYRMHTSVLLNENGRINSDVGFQTNADFSLDAIWGNSADGRLFKIQIFSPQLWIRSRKAPSPEGFVQHASRLDNYQNKPFLVQWKDGKIQRLYVDNSEEPNLVNFKKGLASLFQLQLSKMESNETDSSGHCTVSYWWDGPNVMVKEKLFCSDDEPQRRHPDRIFNAEIHSRRRTTYTMAPDGSHVVKATSDERHSMAMVLKKDAGNELRSLQTLVLVKETSCDVLEAASVDEAVKQAATHLGLSVHPEKPLTQRQHMDCDQDCDKFAGLVEKTRPLLAETELGSFKSARAFIRLVKVARKSAKEELVKVLQAKANKDILPQLIDVIGFCQTLASHEAAMKLFQLEKEKHIDRNERYLWALSLGTNPQGEVIKDLLDRLKKSSKIPEKVRETLLLAIATTAYNYRRLPQNAKKIHVYNDVKSFILKSLESCKTDDCLVENIRALQNLRDEQTLSTLLNLVPKASNKVAPSVVQAIKSLPSSSLDQSALKLIKNVLYQKTRKFDSSARTLAMDILAEYPLSDEELEDLLHFSFSRDPAYEVKKYVLEKLNMLADTSQELDERMRRIVRSSKLNNYSAMAARGFSTALSRDFLRNPSLNCTIVSVQEMNSGVVKRGSTDVVLETDSERKEIYSLGVFAKGLSSMLSPGEAEDEEDETITAGIDVKLFGMQIRPFVFFSGQGELMGHVWSGTASDRTPAYQAILLLCDQLEYIRLGTGFVAEFSLYGASSIELAGQVSISLWNRNAQTLVENNSGIALIGKIRVDTSYIKSMVEFSLFTEPKLLLATDVDFGGNTAVCIKFTQKDSTFIHNVFKIERIPGSEHRLRRAQYRTTKVPGKSYFVNRKNNEMCRAILRL